MSTLVRPDSEAQHRAGREIHYRRKRDISIFSAFAHEFTHVSMRATTYHDHHQMRVWSTRSSSSAAHPAFPRWTSSSARSCTSGVRRVHSPLLAPNDVLLADLLHAPALRPRRRHLRFPLGVSQPVLHGGLRDDPLPAPRPRRRGGAPAQAWPQTRVRLSCSREQRKRLTCTRSSRNQTSSSSPRSNPASARRACMAHCAKCTPNAETTRPC